MSTGRADNTCNNRVHSFGSGRTRWRRADGTYACQCGAKTLAMRARTGLTVEQEPFETVSVPAAPPSREAP